jgi:hypothetical protein
VPGSGSAVAVRCAGGVAPLASVLRDWHARLTARSRAMLAGAAALDAYLGCLPAASAAATRSRAQVTKADSGW